MTLLSELAVFSGKGCSAGGEDTKRSSPPTTAASPEYGRPPRFLLRPAFSPRSWLAVTSLCSDERPSYRSWQFSPVKVFSAGGNHPNRSLPPTTAASPEYGRPPRFLLRPALSPRSWLAVASLSYDERTAHRSSILIPSPKIAVY